MLKLVKARNIAHIIIVPQIHFSKLNKNTPNSAAYLCEILYYSPTLFEKLSEMMHNARICPPTLAFHFILFKVIYFHLTDFILLKSDKGCNFALLFRKFKIFIHKFILNLLLKLNLL